MHNAWKWLLLGTLALGAPALADVDFSGSWALQVMDWPGVEPLLGNFVGLPINDAARMRGETYNPARFTVPEHQCETHPIDYAMFLANLRIWSDVELSTQQVIAIHQTDHFGTDERIIWMDGRPHPSEYAPHPLMGFSTGHWEADTLVVTTTHMRAGFLRRNGLPRSEAAKLTEYWMRNGDVLSVVMVLEDPKYLTEPLVRSANWIQDPGYLHEPAACSARVETVRPQGYVAYYLPGENAQMIDARKSLGLPLEALLGGAYTTTPEFARKLRELALRNMPGQTRSARNP